MITVVEDYNLQQGIENSLDSKLQAALNVLAHLNENNVIAACTSLANFIGDIEEELGKGNLTESQADELITAAHAIRSSLSCAEGAGILGMNIDSTLYLPAISIE